MILNWLVGAYMASKFYNEHPQILSSEKINVILLHCSLESVTYILIKVQSPLSQ